jgi:hypothetical protein
MKPQKKHFNNTRLRQRDEIMLRGWSRCILVDNLPISTGSPNMPLFLYAKDAEPYQKLLKEAEIKVRGKQDLADEAPGEAFQ